jgi:SpoVK/Ycf46/Vps4 family AAA+-type ATPase
MAVQSEANTSKAIKSDLVKSIIRKQHRTPIAFYQLKDMAIDVVYNPNFLDAVLMLIGFLAIITAFPYYPLIVSIILLALLFIATMRHPFLGLIVLMVLMFPIVMYQMPLLAWVFMLLISVSLIFGYMHYRTLAFAYILVPLAFSHLGYFLAIPMFIMAALVIGSKRAIILSVMLVLGIVMVSGTIGVQNTGYIVYNPQPAYAAVSTQSLAQYVTPGKPELSLPQFIPGTSKAFDEFKSGGVLNNIPFSFNYLISALQFQPVQYLLELAGLIVVVLIVDMFAVTTRSAFKGVKSSLAGLGYPVLYIVISLIFNAGGTYKMYAMALASFVIAPAVLYILELYNVKIVKALDVKKQDIRMKFGEAFEDLQSENYTGSFADIGNYDATKKELYDAVIAPIEERGISRAYNVKPAKGILLFGPPGTGKTMLMRALANDIKAGFYLVKASNLISSFPGETERTISNIFAIAKKNAPAVLFFDEIDAVARGREQDPDETHRQALSQLLMEIDGFQKMNNVVVVGATNAPQLIDSALLRPGRFDKLIYMPLPDFNGRKSIFKIYLSKLPVSKSINIDALAEKTERYSGADIKALTENIAQIIAQEASSKHKVLEITQEDIMNAIRATKPSTSLSQIEDYSKFRMDFERRSFEEGKTEKTKQTNLDDVIGLEEAKKAIVEAIQIPLMHPDLIKRYDIKPINGLLLFGPPGTGKSMLMRAVGNEMTGVTTLELKGSDLSNQDRASALAIIKDTFNRAMENIPSIIFIDEIDAIVPKREGASEKGVQVTGEMLEEIDGIKKFSGIVVIAATNRPDALDAALLRPGRFDKIIFIKPPDADDRAELFEVYLKNVPISKDMDFKKLGEESGGFTGADISNICREAKTKALAKSIRTGQEINITFADIEALLQSMRPSAPSMAVSAYLAFLERYGQR